MRASIACFYFWKSVGVRCVLYYFFFFLFFWKFEKLNRISITLRCSLSMPRDGAWSPQYFLHCVDQLVLDGTNFVIAILCFQQLVPRGNRTISFFCSSIYLHFACLRGRQGLETRHFYSSARSCRPAASQRPSKQWNWRFNWRLENSSFVKMLKRKRNWGTFCGA